jgi:2-hydroxychromene-2-carboxylate isomerase
LASVLLRRIEALHQRSLSMSLKRLTFYLDFISPYAYLAFERLPQALEGISYAVSYQPVLFASMLKAHGNLGPAELAPKREWTYRHVLWLAQAQGTPMRMPAAHPFNPLALLRLALACSQEGHPNRWVCETIFRHVWAEGGDPNDAQRLAQLSERLQPVLDPAGDEVKQRLKSASEQAIAAGVFGVPLGFALIIIVSLLTAPPRKEIQQLVEHVRYPNIPGDTHAHAT